MTNEQTALILTLIRDQLAQAQGRAKDALGSAIRQMLADFEIWEACQLSDITAVIDMLDQQIEALRVREQATI